MAHWAPVPLVWLGLNRIETLDSVPEEDQDLSPALRSAATTQF
jgi:hypothetical protein